MKPKTYLILSRCVEEGIERGLLRAYKHHDSPSTEQLINSSVNAVMIEICEWFDFDDEEEVHEPN
jgi:hypothetical protein